MIDVQVVVDDAGLVWHWHFHFLLRRNCVGISVLKDTAIVCIGSSMNCQKNKCCRCGTHRCNATFTSATQHNHNLARGTYQPLARAPYLPLCAIMASNPIFAVLWLALLVFLAWPIAGVCAAVGQLMSPTCRVRLGAPSLPSACRDILVVLIFEAFLMTAFLLSSFHAGVFQIWLFLQVRISGHIAYSLHAPAKMLFG